jgi:hypothetical protein
MRTLLIANLLAALIAVTIWVGVVAFAADDPAGPVDEIPITREATWSAPTQNTDGSSLDNLAVFELVIARRGEDLNADADGNGVPDSEPILRSWYRCTLAECKAVLEEQFTAGMPAEPWSLWVRAINLNGTPSEWAGPANLPGVGRIPGKPHNLEIQVILKIPVATP